MRSGPRRGFAGAYKGSITNQPTCGGDKKQGLAPKLGRSAAMMLSPSWNRAANRLQFPKNCAQAIAGGNGVRPMPLSRNPACSGGVGRYPSGSPACGIWRI